MDEQALNPTQRHCDLAEQSQLEFFAQRRRMSRQFAAIVTEATKRADAAARLEHSLRYRPLSRDDRSPGMELS